MLTFLGLINSIDYHNETVYTVSKKDKYITKVSFTQ